MTFTLSLAKALKKAGDDAEKVARGTLIQLSTNIIKRTPVGNPDLWLSPAPVGYVGGSLRGAWNASIGSSDMSSSKGRIDKSGAKTIGAVAVKTETLKMGQTFYLTNPLPYAHRVEFGWSSQAPQGMVRRSIVEANRILNGEVTKTK